MPCANNKGEVAWNVFFFIPNTVVDVQCWHYACAFACCFANFFHFLSFLEFASLAHSLGERKETRRRQTWVSMNANATLAPYLYNLNEIQTWKFIFPSRLFFFVVFVCWMRRGKRKNFLLCLTWHRYENFAVFWGLHEV